MKFFLCLAVVAISVVVSQASSKCENPKVKATSYTPSDAQVLTHIPFIAEFTLACSNGATDVLLYANINGALVPVARSEDGSKYQVSWTKELKDAKPGDHEVNLYDDEGYSAVKRILERGEDPASVKPLVTIVINYPGAYKGPWVNSEHMALLLAGVVFYMAYSTKSRLLA